MQSRKEFKKRKVGKSKVIYKKHFVGRGVRRSGATGSSREEAGSCGAIWSCDISVKTPNLPCD